jgi:hypothetical protein
MKPVIEKVYHRVEQTNERAVQRSVPDQQKPRWHKPCLTTLYQPQEPENMKKTTSSFGQSRLTLGDLVLAVSSVSRNPREAAAAVTDLLESGKVRLTSNGRTIRARVA